MITVSNPALIAKYDVAAPRYTSYPTVPYWLGEQPDADDWGCHVYDALIADREISLYIHLPFCESLCTYCGCNKHITKNHAVESPYIQAVLAEWNMYRVHFKGLRPVLRELHLGGGTPTFFASAQLRHLLEQIFLDVDIPESPNFAFEAHPWSTTFEHLETLYDLGFKRISLGVQDFDEDLMRLVNRRQTIDSVIFCTENARKVGYDSINYDFIFGLPKQEIHHIHRSADYVARLLPERIAFYSYAHVPWLKKSQTAYSEEDLPVGAAKRALYEVGRERFESMGYQEIGMDHFALPNDSLTTALSQGRLHRNFMGYTTSDNRLTIGLGVSAIGDTWTAFAQNVKTVAEYQDVVLLENRLPLLRGHFLTEEDQLLRRHILNLMTRGNTFWADALPVLNTALERLIPMQNDGLVKLSNHGVEVTEIGKPFLRNVCMAFDAHYWERTPEGRLFSQSV